MSSIVEITSKIKEIIEQNPERRILGTRLAEVLRADVRFDPAIHGKLKDFVVAHVPEVTRTEPKGKDWFYGFSGESRPKSSPEAQPSPGIVPSTLSKAAEGPLWKTFASPNTKFRLLGNPQTGQLAIVPPGRPVPGTPWVVIPPCTPEKHVGIANAFLEDIGNPTAKSILRAVVDQAGSGPASNYYQTVTALGLAAQWNRFRRERILKLLESSLDEAGIHFTEVVGLESHIEVHSAPTCKPTPLTRAASEDSGIRHVVMSAVGRMSETELRSLTLPLGYVLDAIGNR